jgi:hypothetical protein
LVPVLNSSKEASIKTAIITETRLAEIFWLIAFILLFAERGLSFYNHKTNNNG